MKFEVVRKYDNKTMMSTEHESCIGFEHLDSQESSGYYFRLDGKKITAKELKTRFTYNEDNVQHNTATVIDSNTELPSTSSVRKVRPIRCINNGKIYKNMSEAGKDIGLDSALISYSLKVGRPTKGYTFEFVD